jgi:bacteriocin biosynthesis cyclodehydratase domain-containing protein
VAAPEVLAAVRHRPHLLVTVRETTAAVGPMVLPGDSPCLRCMHLARADRDPHWAALSAQLAGDSRPVEPCDVVLATLAAAHAAAQVLAAIDSPDRRPASVGGVLELGAESGQLRRRSITPHPSCGCGATDDSVTMVM